MKPSSSDDRLGQLLIRRGHISPSQLQTALGIQSASANPSRLGQILLREGLVSDTVVLRESLQEQARHEVVVLEKGELDSRLRDIVPAQLASAYGVVPLKLDDGVLTVALPDPDAGDLIQELAFLTGYAIYPVLGLEGDIQAAIQTRYGIGARSIERLLMDEAHHSGYATEEVDETAGDENSMAAFLSSILSEAVTRRATDIHIEPREHQLSVRCRVDGVLCAVPVPEKLLMFKEALATRIKVLARLNIAEHRQPQDGRFKIDIGDMVVDVRVSFLPTPSGESVVMRLLDIQRLVDLARLGLEPSQLACLGEMIQRQHGIIFLTGPTGSGKTTTLYACLNRLNERERKIITIEDPIEYRLDGITQIQVHPAIGLTFARGLRSTLRHDPDVMMIGEVRDGETAQIATQVALTGHLIFSTLHTNDAASGVTRLMDMGIEPYLITSTVLCFIAQRLVRTVCPRCSKEALIDPLLVSRFGSDAASITIRRGIGCEHCLGTGYFGREAIYEFLVMNDELCHAILQRQSAQHIQAIARRHGMQTLRQAGWQKMLGGRTTPEEVLRVTQQESEV